MQRKGPSFTNFKLQKSFHRNGYVVMDFLDGEQTKALRNIYETFRHQHENIDIPFISTSHSNNKELIQSVDDAILNIVGPAIKKNIPDAQILFSNFLVKKCGQGSASDPHQDVTFVDESKYISYSIWIPLVDVNSTNGCMRVLSGSHLFYPNVRTHSSANWIYSEVKSYILREMISCPMKKGQALVFSHALIHGSFPNQTPDNRISAVIACYPQGADLFHYQESSEAGKLGKYKMNKEAYVSYIKGAPPALGKFLEEVKVDTRPHTRLTYCIQKQIAAWKKLATLFS